MIGLLLFITAYFVCIKRDSFIASIFGFPLISIAFGLVVAVAIIPASSLYKFKSKFTSFIAALSYSIYLVHKITIHLTQKYFTNLGIATDGTLMFLLSIIFTLFAAFLLRLLIEKPAIQLREMVLTNKSTSIKVHIPTR